MKFFLALVVLSTVIVANNAQFSCTSNAQFTASFDGSQGSAVCSNGNSLHGRCAGCCEAWGMSRGVHKDQITGFTSADGRRCTCCGNLRNVNPQIGTGAQVFSTGK